MRRTFLVVLTIFFSSSGCAGSRSPSVKGIGSDRNDYKKSPCACGELIEQPNRV